MKLRHVNSLIMDGNCVGSLQGPSRQHLPTLEKIFQTTKNLPNILPERRSGKVSGLCCQSWYRTRPSVGMSSVTKKTVETKTNFSKLLQQNLPMTDLEDFLAKFPVLRPQELDERRELLLNVFLCR